MTMIGNWNLGCRLHSFMIEYLNVSTLMKAILKRILNIDIHGLIDHKLILNFKLGVIEVQLYTLKANANARLVRV